MSDMSHIPALVQAAAQPQPAAASAEGAQVRRLFMVLHGAYGTAFVSKFGTGERDANGKDKGIRSAMQVWQSKLAAYPADVIEAAAARVMDAHPEFPPTLPQFEALCRAAMPRKTYAEEAGLPRLPAPVQPDVKGAFVAQGDGKDWARRILANIEAGAKPTPTVARFAKEALGIDPGPQRHARA